MTSKALLQEHGCATPVEGLMHDACTAAQTHAAPPGGPAPPAVPCLMMQTRNQAKSTCQMHARPPAEVAPHQLAQVVAAHLVPEPVCQPARLVGHQDALVLWPHALICYARKVPAGMWGGGGGTGRSVGLLGEVKGGQVVHIVQVSTTRCAIVSAGSMHGRGYQTTQPMSAGANIGQR